nr:butyrate kinase [Neobittarella massiliensis]
MAINPGSTTTKIAVYKDQQCVLERALTHDRDELDRCGSVMGQKPLRQQMVMQALREAGQGQEQEHIVLDAVVGRCGMVKPLDSGTYRIGDKMVEDLSSGEASLHASSLGGLIARDIGDALGIPAFTVDPVVTDELVPQAKLTGMPGIERRSIFHALNAKAMARRACAELGKSYQNSRLIVAHMGGGITVGAHHYGRVIDVNDAMMGEGPFTPERSGALPLVPVIDMCFSGQYSRQEMVDLITNQSGMQALLGTNDLRVCEKMIKNGDSFAALVLESMAYQVSKQIGAMVAVLCGRVDGIVLTGGMAYSDRFTGQIKERVDLIAPVFVYPGESEMLAMAQGALAALQGSCRILEYE